VENLLLRLHNRTIGTAVGEKFLDDPGLAATNCETIDNHGAIVGAFLAGDWKEAVANLLISKLYCSRVSSSSLARYCRRVEVKQN